MNEYVKQAKDFLEACNATMKITWIGCEINKNWNINAGIYNLFDKNFTDSYETYSNRGTLIYVNTYNRIEEGRRLYLSSAVSKTTVIS